MSEKNYIAVTAKEFFQKLDKIHDELSNFSTNINDRRETVFKQLNDFKDLTGKMSSQHTAQSSKLNAVQKALNKTIDSIHSNIESWYEQIAKNKKGTEFMHTHEKYLVVMVFGAVKAGKSSLGNFFAGKYLKRADFDNVYKHCEHPVFDTQEAGRKLGGVETDKDGYQWFSEGVTDTTGSIQYYTLSGLRWMDSPGTGALQKADDIRNMEDMVNEYLPYTDMCIFLMNSSEPGLQADMKYIEKLSREGQEAIVVITKSDFNDEDVDDEGNLITKWAAKTPENRKLQEDDICQRIHETYPDIPQEKFRAISISTLLANEAIKNQDEQLYKDSNLDRLMKILGDKVSDDAIHLKEVKPKKNVNNFIDSIINGEKDVFKGIDGLNEELVKIKQPIDKYKTSITESTTAISGRICRNVRIEVRKRAQEWEAQVNSGSGSLDPSKEILRLTAEIMNKELNSNVAKIIDNYQEQQIKPMTESLNAGRIEKRTDKVAHHYTESYVEERDPNGLWENVRHFFGKNYYRTRHVQRVEYTTIDLGTNISDYLEQLMPMIKSVVDKNVAKNLQSLKETYFLPQEEYVNKMRTELQKLRSSLLSLKFK